LKGDASVVARGAVSLMQLETLQLRRNEFLTATANPMDSQIVGLEGRAEILREVAKGLQMDINKVVPKKVQQPVPQQAQPGGQQPPAANQETLQNGAAVTDNFSPNSMRSV
jgi:TolA-binding protein